MIELPLRIQKLLENNMKEISQVLKIIVPVMINMLLTLTGWYFVYDCEPDPRPFAKYFLDSRHNYTTGSDVYDGAVNGFICICLLALMSFCMLVVALYKFKKVIRFWLGVSCLMIVFGISSMFFRDLIRVLNIEDPNWILTATMTLTYGTGGVFAFFTNLFPLWMHQVYVVTNCSLVSLYYLRMLPAYTTWFMLATIIVWDTFAVLAPQGPLNLVTSVAEDYNETILRFLMFTAEIRLKPEALDVKEIENVSLTQETEVPPKLPTTSNAVDAECTTADCISDAEGSLENHEIFENAGILPVIGGKKDNPTEKKVVAKKKLKARTAKDALDDDNSIHLGLGDFVFYSVLVGKAASSRSFHATIMAMHGVTFGLLLTLTVLAKSDETMPALPLSIGLGMLFHFQALYISEPIIKYSSNILLFVFNNIFPVF